MTRFVLGGYFDISDFQVVPLNHLQKFGFNRYLLLKPKILSCSSELNRIATNLFCGSLNFHILKQIMFNIVSTRLPNNREIAILGSKGSLELNTSISELKLLQQSKLSFDYESLKFLVGETPTITTIIDHPRIEPLHAEHLAFQEALMNKSDNPNIVQMYDAIKSLEVLEAALESQSTNKIISILES